MKTTPTRLAGNAIIALGAAVFLFFIASIAWAWLTSEPSGSAACNAEMSVQEKGKCLREHGQ